MPRTDCPENPFSCPTLDQRTVSKTRDYALIPGEDLLHTFSTPQRQNQHKGRQSLQPLAGAAESVDEVSRHTASPRHIPTPPITPEQASDRRDSRLSFTETTKIQSGDRMPLSPPQTPDASSIYSRSAKSRSAIPSPHIAKKVRPAIESLFPRFAQAMQSIPRKERIPNVRHLPTGQDRERVTIDRRGFTSVVVPKSNMPKRSPCRQPKCLLPPGDQAERLVHHMESVHVGVPCLSNSLDHVLTCSHKVMTTEIEACASNCQGSHDYDQPRDLDRPFACMACIADHIQEVQYGRLVMHTAMYAEEAARLGKSDEYVLGRIAKHYTKWMSDDLREMTTHAEKGRICQPMWIEPEVAELAEVVLSMRQRPVRTSLDTLNPGPTQRPTAEPVTTRSRAASSVQQTSPRASFSSLMNTDGKMPSLRQSVNKLFAGREKKDELTVKPPERSRDDVFAPE